MSAVVTEVIIFKLCLMVRVAYWFITNGHAAVLLEVSENESENDARYHFTVGNCECCIDQFRFVLL